MSYVDLQKSSNGRWVLTVKSDQTMETVLYVSSVSDKDMGNLEVAVNQWRKEKNE